MPTQHHRAAYWRASHIVLFLLGATAGLSVGPATAQTKMLGGYAVDGAVCGTAPRAFPKLRIGLREGYCAGLVASEADGLIFPRSIIQIPGHELFVVVDMVAWNSGRGRLLLLDPSLPAGKRIKELITRLNNPFGLALGADNKIYTSTDTTIFRFDPMAADPRSTMEIVIHGLPGQNIKLPDGTTNNHPLKAFVFDKTGRLLVNIGAPSDSCTDKSPIVNKACAAGEGAAPMAAIWAFTPPANGIFPTL